MAREKRDLKRLYEYWLANKLSTKMKIIYKVSIMISTESMFNCGSKRPENCCMRQNFMLIDVL